MKGLGEKATMVVETHEGQVIIHGNNHVNKMVATHAVSECGTIIGYDGGLYHADCMVDVHLDIKLDIAENGDVESWDIYNGFSSGNIHNEESMNAIVNSYIEKLSTDIARDFANEVSSEAELLMKTSAAIVDKLGVSIKGKQMMRDAFSKGA